MKKVNGKNKQRTSIGKSANSKYNKKRQKKMGVKQYKGQGK